MAIRTSYRHNKDGTITKRTTYSHKTIMGNTVSETVSEVVNPQAEKKKRSIARKIAFGCIIFIALIYFITK